MEIIVTTIAEKVAQPIIDYTVAPLARQVGYLVFYNDNFKNLKDQVVELKRMKGTISHEVEAERRNGRQIYDAVQIWLDKVDEIIEEAEKLSDDPRHRNVGCCNGPFPDLKSRHQLSRKATKMAGNVVEVMRGKDNIGPLAFLPGLEGLGSTSTTISEKLESRRKMKEDIVLALRDTNLSRIGVYGLGGVGKTALVKEIAKQAEDDKLFDEVVMANISQAVDLERIQSEIADLLGLHFEETTITGRAARLRQRIRNERSILVILDYVWELLELDQLGIPLNDHKGCKLLLTSRNLDILKKMETQKDFLIDVLSEAEAWSLFEDMVGDVVKDVSLRDVAIQVAQKCAGLIVLIVTVARALKNRDNIDFWKDALSQLKTVDKEGMNEIIYSALEFSYNHLEGDEVKALFLLCGLLGPQIQVEYLFKCVMGLGIFKQIYTPKDVRLKLHRLIGSLKASCLLLENNSKEKVQMHDIVHEVAVSIASRDQHVLKIERGDELKIWPQEVFLQRCTQIILKWCHIPKLPERSIKVERCDQLKYLFSVLMVKALCQLIEIEVSECNSMKKIVSCENSFPNPVNVDDNIEFCSLRSLTLQFLPTIEDFYSSLLTCSTTTEKSLSSYTNVPPSPFFDAKVKFSNLETLKLSSIHLENIWLHDDHLSIANSFHKLANLCIEKCSGLKYLFSSSMVGSIPNLKELEIRDCEKMEEIIGLEGRNGSTIKEVGLPKLETVVISNMKRMETLKVSDCGLVKEIFKLPTNEINSEEETQLKKLHLLRLPKLKRIWSSKEVQGNFRFHNLQDVHVQDCEYLEYLFPFSIALDLHQLEELTVRSCDRMNEIVAKTKGPTEEKELFHFGRLYSMHIRDMLQLDRFYGGSHSLTCPSLRILRIFNCGKLKLLGRQRTSDQRYGAYDQNPHPSMQQPLFIIEKVTPKLEQWTINNKEAIMMLQDPHWKDHHLSNLKILRLCDFDDKAAATFLDTIVQKAPNLKILVVHDSYLKDIFRDKRAAYNKEGKNEFKTQLQSLSLIELQLQHICREGCQVDPILEVLEGLYVIGCANLKTLVPSSVTFSHLIYLKIEKCNELINLIYTSTTTSLVNLKYITLKECKSLEEIVTQGMNETRDEIVFRSLRTLKLNSLPRLKSFSSSQCFFRTMKKIYADKIAFRDMEHLDLSICLFLHLKR
ncbi:hypothetical protein K1719_016721 [Acacia pycnantha]|nr:hypothetical protein K1719_016721 [Acacia pycnantha]